MLRMQDVSVICDDSHIITSSNSNKKLSFQGWEKCVEAFSQGKGHLSHHCSRLMSQMDSPQLDTPRLDEDITWSSSDGECDKSSTQQQIRLRPTRTLSSQINFDDCKPLRQRGRRHTSAQFVRCVEKRLSKESQSCENSQVNPFASPQMRPLSYCENLEVNSVHEDQFAWLKNVSLLNQRINLTSSCSDSFNVENNSVTHFEVSASIETPEDNQENRSTSPILGLHENKRHKRKIKLNSDGCDTAVSLDKGRANCQTPGSQTTSPIFKTSSHKKRKGPKVSGDCSSKVESNLLLSEITVPLIPGVNEGSKSICDNISENIIDSSENSSYLPSKGNNNMTMLSPNIPQKTFELAVSPVIGKSSGKRRKPLPKMKIDKSISPILVSRMKTVKTKRRKIAPSHFEKQKAPKDNKFTAMSDEVFEPSREERSILSHCHSVTPKIISVEVSEETEVEYSNLFNTQSKTAVKRSLDFTNGNKRQVEVNTNFEGDGVLTTGCEKHIGKSSCGQSNVNARELYGRDVQELSSSFSHSHLIEEINTEQLDFGNGKETPATTPLSLKKKKTLSLGRKFHSKVEMNRMLNLQTCKERGNISNLKENLFSRDCQVFHEAKDKLLPTVNSYLSKKSSHQLVNASAAPKTPQNLTLFIEEEFSEPIDKASEDFIVSPLPLQDSNAGISKRTTVTVETTDISDIEHQQKKNDNDVAIDSCSSQSPEDSQLEQIEKLQSPSSFSLSPITISQMSSPPAPAVSSLPLEQVADDFNAPPRKGKRKLKPDGLANRLQRVLNRQRSSARIWQFKRSKQSRTRTSSTIDNQDQSSSTLLIVDRTWNEYSHAIVQGHVHNDISHQHGISRTNALSKCVIVVLDPYVAEQLGRIMLASMIRIFPPWQALKLRGTSVILGANCIEAVSQHSLEPEEDMELSSALSEGFENVSGINISDIIFRKVQENASQFLQCANTEEDLNDIEGPIKQGTISNVVSNHCVGGATSECLTLTILRAFRFRQPDKVGENCSAWSLLGQDTTGELCELVLGCEESLTPDRSIWQDLKTDQIIGRMYQFSGFLPVQRISPFRVSNLWSIVSSMAVLGPCDQSVFYVLGSSASAWKCKPLKNQRRKDLHQPYFSSLKAISLEHGLRESQRMNIICRILHATNERLYITDVDTSPIITVISVNPTAYVPSLCSKATVLDIRDLEIVSEGLRADRYTRIVSIDSFRSFPNNLYNEEQYRCLVGLNPELPMVHKNTPAKCLVLFCGSIHGVDEDSAFMWPACGICGNEVLSVGDSSEKYCCEKCDGQSENFTLQMSLQVLASCPNLPEKSSVRIKLRQTTIETLLPPSLCNGEGYDMNTVLGQKVGPLKCEVLLVKGGNFTLLELP